MGSLGFLMFDWVKLPTGLDYARDKPEKVMEDQDEFFIEDFRCCSICTT